MTTEEASHEELVKYEGSEHFGSDTGCHFAVRTVRLVSRMAALPFVGICSVWRSRDYSSDPDYPGGAEEAVRHSGGKSLA